MATQATERLDISLLTPAGRLTAVLDVPTAPVPATAIVPVMRRLGEEAQALEEAQLREKTGRTRSCQKGCAACCRMLVPLSPPEAFDLMRRIRSLPQDRQDLLIAKLGDIKSLLVDQGLWDRLMEIGEAPDPSDDLLDTLNRDYYALGIPCPFLDQETCSIYEIRPSACRELLVTSPPELCRDMIMNPVEPIRVPVRITSVLGLLWAELTGTAPRLIPLPIVIEWVTRHAQEEQATWPGIKLLDSALDKVWRFLRQAFQPVEDHHRKDR